MSSDDLMFYKRCWLELRWFCYDVIRDMPLDDYRYQAEDILSLMRNIEDNFRKS